MQHYTVPGSPTLILDWKQEPAASHNGLSSPNPHGRDWKPHFHQQYNLHIWLHQQQQVLSEWKALNQFLAQLHTINLTITLLVPMEKQGIHWCSPYPSISCTIWFLQSGQICSTSHQLQSAGKLDTMPVSVTGILATTSTTGCSTWTMVTHNTTRAVAMATSTGGKDKMLGVVAVFSPQI